MRRVLAAVTGSALLLAACGSDPTPTPTIACPTEAPTAAAATGILDGADQAVVTVSGAVEGEFTVDLHADAAPIATASFVSLARCGFYDGIWFHRVLDGFVVQAGDPGTKDQDGDFSGLGRGGPGYSFEIEPPHESLNYDPYSVSMANDQVANGSQFFIALADLDAGLPRSYTIFGQVSEGTDIVDEIAAVPVNDPQIGVPLDLVVIDSLRIEAAAEAGASE